MAGLFFTMMRKRREFGQNKKMTRPQLEALQLQKFRQLVKHAANHSPYYQRIIRERTIDPATCTPEDFPVLSKSILIENFDDIITDRRINKKVISEFLSHSTDPNDLLYNTYHVVHTSGSSGEIAYFVFSEEDWGRGLAQGPRQRRQRDRKIGFRRPRMAYFGAIGGHFAGVSMASMMRRGPIKWLVKSSLNEVNDPLPKVIAHLNEFQPDFISGYTTALKMLAEKQLSGELNISPIVIGSGGESQSDSDRDLFTRAFNCEIGNAYGCSEHLMMAFSSPDHKTMELYDDDLIFDFHEDHSIVTNLFNTTLPLIRYRMSDVLRVVENDNSIAPYRLVHSLVGRTEIVPMFLNRDGSEDFISAFTIIELFIPGVSRFQMRLIDNANFEFAICPDASLDESGRKAAFDATESRLHEILAQKLMENVRFDVLIVDDLPVNEKTGKFQLIVKQPQYNGA
jgi:phenylacetate-coenzyme A ligase PaaK-like adenylate-forming protein